MSKLKKYIFAFFLQKEKKKEHLTEVSAWDRGNYYSVVIESPSKVINLMELGRKEEQEWLVNYLNQEVKKRKAI